MKVVQPFDITPAKMLETNVPLDDYPEYDNSATYEAGDRVIVVSTLTVYECVAAGTISGVDPTTEAGQNDWLVIGKVNRWKLLDKIVGSATEGTYPFNIYDYSVDAIDPQDPNFVEAEVIDEGLAYRIRTNVPTNTLAFFNLSGYYLDVKVVTDSGGLEYWKRIMLRGELSESNWYSYYYEPTFGQDRVVLTDIPIEANKDVYFSIVETTEGVDPKIGEMLIGQSIYLGRSLYGTSVNFVDFSTKERDEFGNFEIVERGYADLLEVDLSIENNQIFYLRNVIASLRTTPTVWISSECIDGTSVYGYVSTFDIVITGPQRSDATLIIQGLI